MNFFAAQDKARHNTALLVLLFAAAAAGLVALLYVAAHLFLVKEPLSWTTISGEWLINIMVGVGALISIGTIYKTLVLASGGGAAIAESMGGRLLSSPATAAERQLHNIVGEMALAAGCPMPRIYIMPDDNINAFAAGTKIGNAVIGVTRGAMNAFSRDEMQGVIAHEFSHIMNGDMRLNLRLIGIIHGIMLLSYLGYFLLRSSLYSSFSSNRNAAAAAMPIAGLVLIVAGAAGAFFGGLIRAAVSRQREYLADAAAVQYTRNPQGIGGALQKIGVKYGLIKHPNAAECAHMFFANGIAAGFSNMLASHPPIEKRIARVLPDWDGTVESTPPAATSQDSKPTAAAGLHSGFAAAGMGMLPPPSSAELADSADSAGPPDLFAALFGKTESADNITAKAGNSADFTAAQKVMNAMPTLLRTALADSYSARALVYAMLLDDNNADCRRAQCEHLQAFADNGVYELTQKIAPVISQLPRPARLPLILQTLPALRLLSPAQYELFAQNLATLIAADQKIDLFEWSLEAVLLHYLQECFAAPPADKLPTAKAATQYALSLLAQAGHGEQAAKAFAAAAAAADLHYQTAVFVPQQLALSMRRLDKMSPAKKQSFIQTAAHIAAHNGIINADESVLLHAFAALLDCPLPPLLSAAD